MGLRNNIAWFLIPNLKTVLITIKMTWLILEKEKNCTGASVISWGGVGCHSWGQNQSGFLIMPYNLIKHLITHIFVQMF